MTDKISSPPCGIYFDIPDADYRAWPYVSQSTLSLFRDPDLCEKDIQFRLGNPHESNDAMQLGTDVENALDGLPVGKKIQCLPEHIKVRRGKAWDEFREAHPGVDWVPASEYAAHGEYAKKVADIVASVKADKLAMRLIAGSPRQVSFVWDATFIGMTGEEVTHRVKGRLDYLQDGVIPDLKTSSFGSPRRIGQWAWYHGWDIQAALYTDAITALTGKEHAFYFVVVRTNEPYVVTLFNGHNTTNAAGEFHQIGRRAYETYLEQLAECQRTGVWHGFYTPDNPDSKVLDIQIPAYIGG